LKKYTPGIFKMDNFHIELSGELSPFLRGCIGIAIVLFAGGLCLWFAPGSIRAFGQALVEVITALCG